MSYSQILATLRGAFNKDEFYGLLFEVGINKNDIGGDSVSDQMRECVTYMERQNQLSELVTAIARLRPERRI